VDENIHERLQVMLNKQSLNHTKHQKEHDVQSLDSAKESLVDQKRVKCKRCRKKIADGQECLTHVVGNGFMKSSRHSGSFNLNTGVGACHHIFIQVPSWIPDPSQNEARLDCPHCGTKLGSYTWSGMPCSCGTWISPAFSLQKDKIDFA
jgi:dual specificity phosphatase 12